MELSSEDRQFFGTVAGIIFSNPFDDARTRIRALVPAAPRTAGATSKHPFGAVVPACEERLERLAAAGVAAPKDVAARDREILGYVMLFRVYHHYVDHFDALIAEQLTKGDEPVAAPFADALLAELRACGFNGDDAARYLALFYQLRRAYYFIVEIGRASCRERV